MRSGRLLWSASRDRLLRQIELVLVASGTAILVCVGGLRLDGYLAQLSARRAIASARAGAGAARSDAPTSSAAAKLTPPAARASRPPVAGEPIGTLSIPRLHLSAVVLHGSDARTLRRGPGHVEDTALPGERGNVVIAGHRDSFFRPLRDVRPDDHLVLETAEHRYAYRVASLRVTNPRDLSVLRPTPVETLTLITCYPFWVFGNAPDRFIVRAVRDDDETAVRPPATARPSAALGDRLVPATAGPPTAERPAPLPGSTSRSDSAQIRAAIERFRAAYNARVLTGRDRSAPLRVQSCDVVMVGALQAFATCQPAGFTFALANRDRGWTITAVVQ